MKRFIYTYKETIEPAFPESPNAIAIVSSKAYLPAASVTVLSIIGNASSSRNYDFIILMDKILEWDVQAFLTIAENRPNVSIRFVVMDGYLDSDKVFTTSLWSHLVYYRVTIYDILSSFEKILSLGADTLAMTDVSELFDIEMEDKCVFAVCELNMYAYKKYMYFGTNRTRHEIELNSDVLLFNVKKCAQKGLAASGLNLISNSEFVLMDQEILNVIMQNNVKYIEYKWNFFADGNGDRLELRRACMPNDVMEKFLEARKNPGIIHYCGQQKPWHYTNIEFAHCFWAVARKSPFYERMISNMVCTQAEIAAVKAKLPENVYVTLLDFYGSITNFWNESKEHIIWGSGLNSIACYHKIKGLGLEGVWCFCDNNLERWGAEMDGIAILSPKDALKYVKNKQIIIPINHYKAVLQQLRLEYSK